jgi:hypothetical protein
VARTVSSPRDRRTGDAGAPQARRPSAYHLSSDRRCTMSPDPRTAGAGIAQGHDTKRDAGTVALAQTKDEAPSADLDRR